MSVTFTGSRLAEGEDVLAEIPLPQTARLFSPEPYVGFVEHAISDTRWQLSPDWDTAFPELMGKPLRLATPFNQGTAEQLSETDPADWVFVASEDSIGQLTLSCFPVSVVRVRVSALQLLNE